MIGSPGPAYRHVAAAALAVFVLVQAAFVAEIHRDRAREIERAERLSVLAADLVENQMRRALAPAVRILHYSAERRLPQDDTRDVFRERMSGALQIAGIVLFDKTGRATTPTAPYAPAALETAVAPLLEKHKADTALTPRFSDLLHIPFDSEPMIPLTRRLADDAGEYDGMALVLLRTSYFLDMVRDLSSLPGATVVLARNNGGILTVSPPASLTDWASMPEFTTPAPHGVLSETDRIAVWRNLSPYPLRVVFSSSPESYLAGWRAGLLGFVVVDAFVVLLIVLAAAAILRAEQRRRRIAHDLYETQKQMVLARTILDMSPDMAAWAHKDGSLIDTDQNAALFLPSPANRNGAGSLSDLLPSFHAEGWALRCAELRRSGVLRFETELKDPIGGLVPVEALLAAVEFDGTDYLCLLLRDMGERRRTESALLDRTRRLEASNADLEQFAYVASHDLREPLRTVNSFVTLLERRCGEELSEEAREYIRFAQDGAQRLDRLILDLLEYSRIGRTDPSVLPVPLSEAADKAMADLSLAVQEADALVSIQPDMPAVIGAESELVRLLGNLIGNALKYRSPQRRAEISVTAAQQGDTVTLVVADNGIGIEPQYYDRIFRIFQRLHGNSEYPGTGIGLAQCAKIAKNHGGRIWVSSVYGESTNFFVALRAAPAF